MEEYKSNSHKSRQNQNDDIPEKRVEKVVSGSVKSKKKNGLQKITNVFVPEDVDDVKSYIFEDIVVPAVKDIILTLSEHSLVLAETQGSGDRQRHPRSLTVSIMTIGIDEIRETYQEHELDTIMMILFWNLVARQKMSWKEWTSLLPHTRWSALQISMISSVCQVTIQTINMDGLIFGMHL